MILNLAVTGGPQYKVLLSSKPCVIWKRKLHRRRKDEIVMEGLEVELDIKFLLETVFLPLN